MKELIDFLVDGGISFSYDGQTNTVKVDDATLTSEQRTNILSKASSLNLNASANLIVTA